MKLSSIGRAALATGMSVALGLGTASCSRDYTVAYVYSVSAQNASVSAFAVDYQSGVLTQIAGSPFTAGINRNPVGVAASPNGKNLYVISRDDSTVTELAIGTDGKLYGQKNYNVTGSFPTALAIDSTGSYLYVTFTYRAPYTPVSPGPGGITVFPINGDGTLNDSAKFTVNVGNNPVGIAVSNPVCSTNPLSTANPSCSGVNGSGKSNVFVYVIDQEAGSNGTILGFYQNTTNGTLTPLSGVSYHAGVLPSAIGIEPTTRFVYVTDASTNLVYAYQIANNTTGNLTALPTSPYTAGARPVGLTIDPRGKYLLTANYNGNSVSSFTINVTDGSLGGNAGSGNAQVATGPTCVTIENALGIYVYTSNSVDGTVSGLQMSPNTGGLTTIANSPFPAGALPSCAVAVANGEHANSIVSP